MNTTIINDLFNTSAVRVSDPEHPFWYASGTLGPFYINTHFLLGSEEKANELLHLIETAATDKKTFPTTILHYLLKAYEESASFKNVTDLIVAEAKKLPDFDFISGGERRDFFFSILPAYFMKKPHLSIFKDGSTFYSTDNFMTCKEVKAGDLSDRKALHIADLITEASSYTRAWIPAIRKLGASISDTIAVIDRVQGGEDNLKSEGVAMHTFVAIEASLFDTALSLEIITDGQREMVASFMASPIDYMKDYLSKHPDFIDEQIALGGKPRERAELAISRGYVPNK